MYLTKKQITQLATQCVPQDSELRTTQTLILQTSNFIYDENSSLDKANLAKAAKIISGYCPFVTSIIIDIASPSDIVSYEEVNSNINSGFIQLLANLAPQLNKLRIEMRTYQEDAEEMYEENWQDALSKTFAATMNQLSSLLPQCINAKEVILCLPDASGIYGEPPIINLRECYLNEQAINNFISNLKSLKKIEHAGIILEEFPYHSPQGQQGLKNSIITLIKNSNSLKSLSFYHDNFLIDGFMPLAQSVTQHDSLQQIDLQLLGLIPDDVLPFLAESKNLKSIHLSNINFDDGGEPNDSAQLIGQAIKANNQLQQLHLDEVYHVEPRHFPYKPIADAIANHRSLESFMFTVSVSEEDIEYGQSVCSPNKALTDLNYGQSIAERNLQKMTLMTLIETPFSAITLIDNGIDLLEPMFRNKVTNKTPSMVFLGN